MLKRFLSLLLVLVMIASTIPVSVSAEGAHTPGTHSNAHTCEKCNKTVSWTAWGDDAAEKTSLPTTGHYYLVADVDMRAGTRTVVSDLCLCLNGYTITGPQAERTLAVAAANKFIAISDCTAVAVDGVYYAGKISGGKNTTTNGGTIYVGNNNCKLYFYNGIIENCESTAGGGAIFVATGSSTKIPKVYMYGGALRNNSTTATGGAVRLGDYGQFYMTGGQITGNQAKQGGGIYAGSNVTVAVKNASVTENHATEQAGGMQVNGGTISLQEEAIITGNTAVNKETANNLYLLKGHAGAAASKLSGKAQIGVTLAADRITAGQMHVTTAVAGTDAAFFTSDDAAYEPKLENNQVVLTEKQNLPPAPPVPTHSHNGCNDTLCTEHAAINYEKWTDSTKLPTSGNWYLDTDVTLTNQTVLTGNLDLCLNGKTVTGPNGKRILASVSGYTLTIADCTAKTENGVYTAGKLTGAVSTASNGQGGAINLGANDTLYLFDGIITGNCSYVRGGGVNVAGTMYMYSGEISGNLAKNGSGAAMPGGGIYVGTNAKLFAYGGIIQTNEGSTGAGIYAGSGATIHLEDVQVTSNIATDAAAGILLTSGTVTLKGQTQITGNTVGEKNENLLLQKDMTGLVANELTGEAKIGVTLTADRITAGQMHVTTAAAGTDAAFFTSDDAAYEPKLENNQVVLTEKQNLPPAPPAPTHSHNGCNDAFCTEHAAINYEKWTDSTKLPTSGNWYLDADVTLTNQTVLTGNLDLCLNGKTVTGPNGKRILASVSGYTLTIADCTAKTENGVYTAGKLTGAVSTVSNGQGGAINLGANDTLYLFDGIITGNRSYVRGGGVNVAGTMYMYGGEISDNTAKDSSDAGKEGGGIYVGTNAKLYAYGGTIKTNNASVGAGIYAGKGATVVLENVTVAGNKAEEHGGAVYATNTVVLDLVSGEITGNSAVKTAGAVLADGQIKMNLSGTTVSGNTAKIGGGIVCQNQAHLEMTGGVVSANVATENAGGVYVSTNSSMNMTGGSVTGNKSEKNTAGINVQSGATLTLSGNAQITDNAAAGSFGGVYMHVDAAQVKVSGDVKIAGNTANEKANNLYLAGNAKFTAGRLGAQGKVGISTGQYFRAVSMVTAEDVSAGYYSDNKAFAVIYNESALYLGAVDGHTHCFCCGEDKNCNHSDVKFAPWEKSDSLPSSGNWYLTCDVTLANRAGLENNSLNLCLNGHGIKVADSYEKGRAFYLRGSSKLTLTDCAATPGAITGAKETAVMFDSGCVGAELNVYNITLTGNTTSTAGGAVCVQGQSVFNLYSGSLSGNTAKTVLLLDDNGQPKLDIAGNQQLKQKLGGGAVAVIGNKATFNMYGGVIADNQALAGAYLKADGKTANGGGYGGAIYSSGNVNLLDGKIANNTAEGNGGGVILSGNNIAFTMADGEISGNKAANAGGILAQNKSQILLEGGVIKNNSAATGGGVYVSTNATITMNGGTISANTATAKGGGMFLLGATAQLTAGAISGNKSGTHGAGVAATVGSVTVNGEKQNRPSQITIGSGVTITQNAATKNAGGIHVAGKDSTLTLSGGSISGNSAVGAAGGVLIEVGAVFVMKSGKISDNRAKTGAGAYISADTSIRMEGGSVTGNHATGNTGGIQMLRSQGVFSGGTISNNTTDTNGGGLYLSGATATLSGTSITNNTAVKNGGGVALSQVASGSTQIPSKLVINGSSISGNKGIGGGGVLVQTNTTLELHSGEISNNQGRSGGGIYAGTDSTVTMTGGSLSYNSAENHGGAVYHQLSVGNYTGGIITGNTAGVNGGGFMITGKTAFITMKGVELHDMEAGSNAAVALCQARATLNMENCKIYDNAVIKGSGAIYVSSNSFANLTDCQFFRNTADKDGGAFYGAANCHVDMMGCEFTENESRLSGGAVLCRGNVTMTDCTVSNNKAAVNGGGISTAKCGLRGSKFQEGLVMNNVTMADNEAVGQGGGLYLSTGCRTTMTDVTITGNIAGAEGGAFWAVDDTTLHNVTATGNTSGGKGYAVWYSDSLYDGHSYFVGVHKISGDMIVTDNNGGDMYLGKDTAITIAKSGLGENAKIVLTLDAGVVTNRLHGAYHYEGGNCVYTITYGDRSLTEPEHVALTPEVPEDTQPTEVAAATEESDNSMLYLAIGGIAAVLVIAAVFVVILKKKAASKSKN